MKFEFIVLAFTFYDCNVCCHSFKLCTNKISTVVYHSAVLRKCLCSMKMILSFLDENAYEMQMATFSFYFTGAKKNVEKEKKKIRINIIN